MCLRFFVNRRNYINDRQMERKKVIIELEVLTSRFVSRDIERDLDRVLLPLKEIESGETKIDKVEIITMR